MNDVAVVESRAVTLTAAQVKGHVQLIQQVMESVMKEGVHYGVIPGTDKPTLLKPGAEVLMSTFRIAVDPQIEDLSTSDEIRYRIRCVGTHQMSGVVMGIGVGECSSNEEKYKWKRANKREFDATPEDRRRVKFGYDKYKKQEYETQQVRTEPADVANTILKMAKKRSLVDFTLTALAASDCFNQDLDEMDEAMLDSAERPAVRKPTPKGKPAGKREEPASQPPTEQADPNARLSEGQLRILKARIESAQISDEQFQTQFGVALADLPAAKFNHAAAWVREMQEAAQQ